MENPIGDRLIKLEKAHQELIRRPNEILHNGNGIFDILHYSGDMIWIWKPTHSKWKDLVSMQYSMQVPSS